MSPLERVLLYFAILIVWIAVDFGIWTWRQRKREAWMRGLRERNRMRR